MNSCRFVLLSLLSGAACLDMPAATPDAVTCPPPPDLAQPLPKCAAAKGLAGDNLVCADFNQIPSLPDAQRLPGWDFVCLGGASWTTSGGLLQVRNFGMLYNECTALLPAASLTGKNNVPYQSFSFSVIHRMDLLDPEQKAEIFLGHNGLVQRQMYVASGKKDVSRQRTIIEIDQADLPAKLTEMGWLLRLSSTGIGGRQGWQIESIAVNGVP